MGWWGWGRVGVVGNKVDWTSEGENGWRDGSGLRRESGGWLGGCWGFGGCAEAEGDRECRSFGGKGIEGDVGDARGLEREGREGYVDLVVAAEFSAVGEFYVLASGE